MVSKRSSDTAMETAEKSLLHMDIRDYAAADKGRSGEGIL